MSKTFRVKILTTPLLKKFILTRYSPIGAEAIEINNYTLLGSVIISMLNKPNFTTVLNNKKRNRIFATYTDNLLCVCPLSLMPKYGFEVSKDQAIQINRYFEHYFDEALYLYCQKFIYGVTKRRCGYDEAILAFVQMHNIVIDEDINFETLKKKEYRYRKSIQEKFRRPLSSQKPPNSNTQQTFLFV